MTNQTFGQITTIEELEKIAEQEDNCELSGVMPDCLNQIGSQDQDCSLYFKFYCGG